jgi:hypothetical protein
LPAYKMTLQQRCVNRHKYASKSPVIYVPKGAPRREGVARGNLAD